MSSAPFVHELQLKLAAGMPAGFWQGYELELSDFDLRQLAGINDLLKRWQNEAAGIEFDSVLDLSLYGDRVTGMGKRKKLLRLSWSKRRPRTGCRRMWPRWVLTQKSSDVGIHPTALNLKRLSSDWTKLALPVMKQSVCQSPKHRSRLPPPSNCLLPGPRRSPLSRPALSSHRKRLAAPYCKSATTLMNRPTFRFARQHYAPLWTQRQSCPACSSLRSSCVSTSFKASRGCSICSACPPSDVSGCLLADDMGLGKTIQLLTFLVWYLEKYPQDKPTLIVAPVSLLDNWERELHRFFFADALPVLKLYGSALSAVKFKKEEIPADLKAKGIKNLLRPGWMGGARIVLTTYETLRDQEFSLARQQWSIVVCDEAQKLKNPQHWLLRRLKPFPHSFEWHVPVRLSRTP